MTITRNWKRARTTALVLLLGAPLVASKPAAAQSSTFGDKVECGSTFSDARFQYGLLTAELPSVSHPNSVLISYDFGLAGQYMYLEIFRFYYSTPAGPFALPRAEIFDTRRIKGSFEVPAIAGPHRIQIDIGFWDNRDFDGFGYGVKCESNFVVAPFTATTVFTQKAKKLVIPGGASQKNGSTAVLKSSVALAPLNPALTTTTNPTATTIAPTTAPVATTTTVGVATTVTPTTAPTATATTTPAATAPATTAARTPSSTAAPVTVAAVANSVTKKTKAKRTVKKRKTTKELKRPATTVKR